MPAIENATQSMVAEPVSGGNPVSTVVYGRFQGHPPGLVGGPKETEGGVSMANRGG